MPSIRICYTNATWSSYCSTSDTSLCCHNCEISRGWPSCLSPCSHMGDKEKLTASGFSLAQHWLLHPITIRRNISVLLQFLSISVTISDKQNRSLKKKKSKPQKVKPIKTKSETLYYCYTKKISESMTSWQKVNFPNNR